MNGNGRKRDAAGEEEGLSSACVRSWDMKKRRKNITDYLSCSQISSVTKMGRDVRDWREDRVLKNEDALKERIKQKRVSNRGSEYSPYRVMLYSVNPENVYVHDDSSGGCRPVSRTQPARPVPFPEAQASDQPLPAYA
jgi:hypothetical protein